MKNIRLLWSLSLILIGYDTAIGQVFRGYNPDATIMVGEQLVYQADFSGNPDNPDDYSLLVARPDMIINQTSGLITWTPVNVEDGGNIKLIVIEKKNLYFSLLCDSTENIMLLEDLVSEIFKK